MAGPVVVPVLPTYLDPERVTHCAIPYGRAIAQRLGTGIVLFSVVEITESLQSYLEAEGEQVDQLVQRWLSQRREAIEKLAQTITDVPYHVEVRIGEPAKEIVAFADERQATALVMSSHGRTGIARLLVGSITFSVAQRARQPLVVVRGRVPVPAPNTVVQLSPVLVPLDGSSLAEEAIDTALQLLGAGTEPLELHLLHVLSDDEEPAEWERYLESVAQRVRSRGLRVDWSLTRGPVAETIAAEAVRRHAGLTAMGTHGRSGVRRVLLGSTAEHVLHASAVPLLLHRPLAARRVVEETTETPGPLRVRDIMTPDPVTVGPDATLEQVAGLMLEHQIGAIPVVTPDGTLLGLIREEDFLMEERPIPFSAFQAPHLFGRWIDPERLEQLYAEARTLKAGDIAREPVITATEDTPLSELAERMVEHDVRHVPVVRDGRLVGIVTRHDILKAVARFRSSHG
ncbi:universal stress protein [Thermomicrobium sp. 4228-Ro]|uniref:universal stress protein n=1 Tax=Thermomicrobium sp. 4228-Ro TaxID=2993937 RepID=UPI0022489DBE|nr:universal stress protein [Thermomicrobium sp. 4228-Ro]MCX2728316.1 universal stress protein [Thermomicrobium sp. 4228-Ro]